MTRGNLITGLYIIALVFLLASELTKDPKERLILSRDSKIARTAATLLSL